MDGGEPNYFALLGLPERFAIDVPALQQAYRAVQSVVHPDRFVTLDGAQRRQALQRAMLVNEAYRTLLDPGQRALYLCARHGVAVQTQRSGAMDPQFLSLQLEWREALQTARQHADGAAMALLKQELCDYRARLLAALTHALDDQANYERAAEMARCWMFVDQFGHDVAAAEDAMAE